MPSPPITARNSKVLSKKMLRHERRMEKAKKKFIKKKFKRHRKWQSDENKRMMRKSLRKMKRERKRNYRQSDMRKDDPFRVEE
jgi:hypothetical protein